MMNVLFLHIFFLSSLVSSHAVRIEAMARNIALSIELCILQKKVDADNFVMSIHQAKRITSGIQKIDVNRFEYIMFTVTNKVITKVVGKIYTK